jgi:hypothetical protein
LTFCENTAIILKVCTIDFQYSPIISIKLYKILDIWLYLLINKIFFEVEQGIFLLAFYRLCFLLFL